MYKRIRYRKVSDYIFESDIYTAKNDVTYFIRLDVKNMLYFIKNTNTGNLIKSQSTVSNLNVLKRNARARLVGLGVNLSNEVRDRTFGLCDKGYNQSKHKGE